MSQNRGSVELYLCQACTQKGIPGTTSIKFGQTSAICSPKAIAIPCLYCDGCCQMMSSNKCKTFVVDSEIAKSHVLNELQLVEKLFHNPPLTIVPTVSAYVPEQLGAMALGEPESQLTEAINPCAKCVPSDMFGFFGFFEWKGVKFYRNPNQAVAAAFSDQKCDICQETRYETMRSYVNISPSDKATFTKTGAPTLICQGCDKILGYNFTKLTNINPFCDYGQCACCDIRLGREHIFVLPKYIGNQCIERIKSIISQATEHIILCDSCQPARYGLVLVKGVYIYSPNNIASHGLPILTRCQLCGCGNNPRCGFISPGDKKKILDIAAFEKEVIKNATETINPCPHCIPNDMKGVFEWNGAYFYTSPTQAVPAVMVNQKCDICKVTKFRPARGSYMISPKDKNKMINLLDFQRQVIKNATEPINACPECLPHTSHEYVFEWKGVGFYCDLSQPVPAAMMDQKCDICKMTKLYTVRRPMKVSPEDKRKLTS